MRAPLLLLLIAIALPVRAAAAPTLGFVEHFTTTTSNWHGGANSTNPGTGGVDGAADGYLLVATTFAGPLATHSNSSEYVGDFIAANVNRIRLCLNDVDANQNLEIHVAIGNSGNFWLCKTGFTPPEHAWSLFTVDLTDSTNFAHIIDLDGGFASALRNADRVHVRHDTAPFAQRADDILGEFGIDNVERTDPERPLILVANHRSFFDMYTVSSVLFRRT